MAKFTARSYDQVALAAQDNTFAAQGGPGAAAAAVSATVTHDGTNVIYITGFLITTTNPAATVNGVATLSGLSTAGGGNGTLSFELVESATFGGELNVEFPSPLPVVDKNTDAVLSVPAIASGGAVSVQVFGYRRPE